MTSVRSRADGRSADALRPIRFETGVQRNPEGSVVISAGGTKVLIAASVQEGVKDFLRGSGRGWVTAEYAMHPRANPERQSREKNGQASGRSQEIQRLVGRALRAAVRLERLGERTIHIDCDVLDADGGTRTAAINGALVALHDAFVVLSNRGHLTGPPLKDAVAAISVGMVQGVPRLDLAYVEDSAAQVDMNVVMTGAGRYVEVQGTGESVAFSEAELKALLKLARSGIKKVLGHQRRLLGDSGLLPTPAA